MTQNKPLVLQGLTTSKLTVLNLNALHSGRRKSIENETDEKLRRALRQNEIIISKVCHSGDQLSDSVYWKGP